MSASCRCDSSSSGVTTCRCTRHKTQMQLSLLGVGGGACHINVGECVGGEMQAHGLQLLVEAGHECAVEQARRRHADGAGEDALDDDALYCLRRANGGEEGQGAGLALFYITHPAGAGGGQQAVDAAAAAVGCAALHELVRGFGVGDLPRGGDVEHVVYAARVEEGLELGQALQLRQREGDGEGSHGLGGGGQEDGAA